jgi:hypothetical protein
MLCDATDPDGSGQCTQYCSQSSPCPAGYSCRATQVGTGGPSVDICRATTETTSPGDGGAPVGDAGDVYADALFEVPDVGTGGDASETQR